MPTLSRSLWFLHFTSDWEIRLDIRDSQRYKVYCINLCLSCQSLVWRLCNLTHHILAFCFKTTCWLQMQNIYQLSRRFERLKLIAATKAWLAFSHFYQKMSWNIIQLSFSNVKKVQPSNDCNCTCSENHGCAKSQYPKPESTNLKHSGFWFPIKVTTIVTKEEIHKYTTFTHKVWYCSSER